MHQVSMIVSTGNAGTEHVRIIQRPRAQRFCTLQVPDAAVVSPFKYLSELSACGARQSWLALETL